MKTGAKILLVVLLCCGLSASTSVAQTEEAPPSLYAIWDIVVPPSKVGEHEDAAKKMAEIYRKQDLPYKWGTASSDEYHYQSWVPVKDLADVSAMFKAFNEAAEKMGPAAVEIDKAMGATFESARLSLWRRNDELSYEPDDPRLKQEEVKFFRYHLLYSHGAKTEKLIGIFKKYKELYKSKNITAGYTVWVGELGVDGPVHCVVFEAKDAPDHFAQGADISKALGEEGDALWKELLSCVRKIEHENYWLRPELGTETPPEGTTDSNP
jgi:hypothetical protein